MKISESSNFEVELPGGEVKTFDTVDAWLQIASEAAKVTTDDDKLRRIIAYWKAQLPGITSSQALSVWTGFQDAVKPVIEGLEKKSAPESSPK